MVEAEPWVIGLVAGLAALIVVLLCVLVIFCVLWARKDSQRKLEQRLEQRQQRQAARDSIMKADSLGIETNSVVATNNNTNWFLKEKPHDALSTPPTLTRAAGNEPFLVGKSIMKYSNELDRSNSYRPSTPQRYGAHHEAEQRMVRLGMIPPRPAEVSGHFPSGYYTEPGRGKSPKGKDYKGKSKGLDGSGRYSGDLVQGISLPRPLSAGNGNISSGYFTEPGRAKSPARGKDGKRRSRELDEQGVRHHGEVLLPVREVQLWPMEQSSSQHPFPLPKEDYNTDGATWYNSRSHDTQSLSSSRSENSLYRPSASHNYPRHGPQAYSTQNVNGRIVAGSLPPDVPPATTTAVIDQYYDGQDTQRLKRVKRVGVPILPD